MQLTEVLQGIGRPVAYYPALRRLCGSVTAVILFDQLLYWSGRGADPGGWIYKTHWDLEMETGLTGEEQKTARDKLKRRGLLIEKRCGIPAKIYFKLETHKINQEWSKLAGSWENYILQKKAEDKTKRQNKIRNIEEYQEFEVIHQTCDGDSLKLDESNPPNLFAKNPATTSIDYAGDYQITTTGQGDSSSSSSYLAKITPDPRLFDLTWQGEEAFLTALAQQYSGQDVYLLADQIDYQHYVQPRLAGHRREPRGLLLMHLRGANQYISYRGYAGDWRDRLVTKQQYQTQIVDSVSPPLAENRYQDACGALLMADKKDENDLREEIRKAVEAGEDQDTATIKIVEDFLQKVAA